MKKYRKMLSCWQAIPIQGLMRFIETQSKTTLVNWAVNYAEEHFLPIYGKDYAQDSRPKLALAYAHKWLNKEVKLPEAKIYILACHEAAKEAEGNPAAQAAARAIGQAASSIHSASHSLGIALYGGLAIAYDQLGLDKPWSELEAFALQECEKMFAALQAVAVENEPNPAKVKWFC
ncbi:MAG: hypothetical protein PHW11_05525 [Anaerolineaceae bacterium]|nr:hypothetical protein [Anaerolineaceae bacterium]